MLNCSKMKRKNKTKQTGTSLLNLAILAFTLLTVPVICDSKFQQLSFTPEQTLDESSTFVRSFAAQKQTETPSERDDLCPRSTLSPGIETERAHSPKVQQLHFAPQTDYRTFNGSNAADGHVSGIVEDYQIFSTLDPQLTQNHLWASPGPLTKYTGMQEAPQHSQQSFDCNITKRNKSLHKGTESETTYRIDSKVNFASSKMADLDFKNGLGDDGAIFVQNSKLFHNENGCFITNAQKANGEQTCPKSDDSCNQALAAAALIILTCVTCQASSQQPSRSHSLRHRSRTTSPTSLMLLAAVFTIQCGFLVREANAGPKWKDAPIKKAEPEISLVVDSLTQQKSEIDTEIIKEEQKEPLKFRKSHRKPKKSQKRHQKLREQGKQPSRSLAKEAALEQQRASENEGQTEQEKVTVNKRTNQTSDGSPRRKLQYSCSFECPDGSEDCCIFDAICADTNFTEFISIMSDSRYDDYLDLEMFTSTNLTTKGDALQFSQVPWDSSYSYPCDICALDLDPCTYFGDPVDFLDCDGNLCSTFDVCSTILDDSAVEGWDPTAVTDLFWQMCPQAKTNPYVYKDSLTANTYWEQCRYFMQDMKETYWSQWEDDAYFYFDNLWYVEGNILMTIMDTYYIDDPWSWADVGWLNSQFSYNNIMWMGYPDSLCNECFWQIDSYTFFFNQATSVDDLSEYGHLEQFEYCATFQENLAQTRMTTTYAVDNPCLSWNSDSSTADCALCKIGSIRIAVITSDGSKFIVCGSVRKPDRADDGSWEFLNPTDAETYTTILDQEYQCYISPFYNGNAEFPGVYDMDSTMTYHPIYYYNRTDTITETMCIGLDDFIDPDYCAHSTVVPTEAQYEQMTTSLYIGCNSCRTNSYPEVLFDDSFGFYWQNCVSTQGMDLTAENAPCAETGYILRYDGFFIEEEQQLVCTACSDIIPNCEVCTSNESCTSCVEGYTQALIYSYDGVERPVCLKNFCGTSGLGTLCSEFSNDGLQYSIYPNYCRRADSFAVTANKVTTTYYSCVVCEPGYYLYTYATAYNEGEFYYQRNCEKQSYELTRDFFVRPEQSDFFKAGLKSDMNEQLHEPGRGQRLDDAFYYLQQAFTLVGDEHVSQLDATNKAFDDYLTYYTNMHSVDGSTVNEYHTYQNVTFNIWLLKGTHHFVQCTDFLFMKYYDADNDYCADLESRLGDEFMEYCKFAKIIDGYYSGAEDFCEFDACETTFDGRTAMTIDEDVLCKELETYFPVRKNYQKYDNVKFYVRPLECKLSDDYFRDLEKFGSEDLFWENCVDFDAGDAKPQIRVHGRSSFNITNFAQFENVEFTGEDTLVQFLSLDADDAMMQDIVDHAPYKFCEYETEASGYLETLEATIVQGVNDRFNYTCYSGWDPTSNEPASEVDEACAEQLTDDILGVRACQGEPHHAEFFESTEYSYDNVLQLLDDIWITVEGNNTDRKYEQNLHYVKRHKVLFNLYAFDSVHSDRTHAPTLNLYNCTFKYFHDKQSLIQVETSNYAEMAVADADDVTERFMARVGEDRGARIDIQDSTFKHSKFCKGMISYRAPDIIEQSVEPNFLDFRYQRNRTEEEIMTDDRIESYVRIKDSVFDNLAHQQTLEVLSNLESQTTVCADENGSVNEFFECQFTQYDQRGFVLNLNSFPGTIQIQGSQFSRNMAYIKDYILQENSSAEAGNYIEANDMKFSEFEDQKGQILFKVCDVNYRAEYFFQKMADPTGDFDDGGFVTRYEQVSTLMIHANQGPIIIKGNVFEENIGTIGGAIHIMSPDFESTVDRTDVNSQPYIYIDSNEFKQNMAYFAGNAVYIAHTNNRIVNEVDYRNMCGAGTIVKDNHFEGNIGLKRHNGGAYLHRCIYFEDAEEGYALTQQTSSLKLAQRDKTESDVGNYTYYYDDPYTVTASMTDLFDSSLEYTVFKYLTLVEGNNFTRNYSGMKGSALTIFKLSVLQVKNNLFLENGPVTSFSESELSPYYKYFTLGTRALTMNLALSCTSSYTNEFDYQEACVDTSSFLDMPSLTGAVHIEHCIEEGICHVHFTNAYVVAHFALGGDEDDLIEELGIFSALHQISKPLGLAEISANVFENNQAMPPLQYQQSIQQQQSSCIHLVGGQNSLRNNSFIGHHNLYADLIALHAPKIYKYMKDAYFRPSQAPLVVIDYDTEVDERYLSLFTDIDENEFKNNQHMQIIVIDLKVKGSLIEFTSTIPRSFINISRNSIQQNKFIGEGSSLISIDGGIFKITDNVLLSNGYLSMEQVEGHPRSVELEEFELFPYSQFIYQNAAHHGIFAFYFERNDIPDDLTHLITGNTFSHNFCLFGCSYFVKGSKIQQLRFESNSYDWQFAFNSGAVYSGYEVSLRENREKPFVLMFKNETIHNQFGTAILVENMNFAGVMIIENCEFHNNVASRGGSINFYQAGIMISLENRYSLDQNYLTMPTHLEELIKSKEEREVEQLGQAERSYDFPQSDSEKTPVSVRIRESLTGDLTLEDLMSADLISVVDEGVTIKYGQIRIYEAQGDLTGYLDNKIVAEGMTLDKFLDSKLERRPKNLNIASTFYNNVFENLIGASASALTIDNSFAIFIANSSFREINFSRNMATEGSTIFGNQANILLRNIKMDGNIGSKGGCIWILSSEFDAHRSRFTNNLAVQGGAIFAIQRTFFQVRESEFIGNLADDGSILYAMSCTNSNDGREGKYISLTDENGQPVPSLLFLQTTFRHNWSQQNMMQILLSDARISESTIEDNYSIQVTHGITLISSTLFVDQTQIYFTDEFQQKVIDLALVKLDTGFFNLYLFSNMFVENKTVVRSILATKNAVLNASALSNVYMSKDVSFINNIALSQDGQTMYLANTKTVQINDSYFEGNYQVNVRVILGNLAVNNSTFTDGKASHIQATRSTVSLQSVTIRDSEDFSVEGHGLWCKSCTVRVTNSTFFKLKSYKSPAIYIHESPSIEQVIELNTFDSNHALGSTGAIFLENAGIVHVKQNQFINNLVSDEDLPLLDWRYCDAGAIFFQCSESGDTDDQCKTMLEGNVFQQNSVLNKGGALRYIHKNFTTVYQAEYSGRRVLSDRALQQKNEALEPVLDTNVYVDNKAKYAQDIASYPATYKYVLLQNGNEFITGDEFEGVIIAPGQLIDLSVSIYDQEGRLYNDENDASGSIELVDKDALPDGSQIVNAESVASQGVLSYSQLNIRQKPDSDAYIKFLFSGLELYGNKMEDFDEPKPLKVHARTCDQGERYSAALTCQPCEVGTRLYDVQDEPGECAECLEMENCYGSNSTAPKAQYWRSSPTSTNYIECYNPDACLGGDEESPLGECATGYDGILCANCIGRYRRSGQFVCAECEGDPATNIIISAGYLLAALLAIVFLVKSTMKGSDQAKPLTPVYIKIFLNHFQILQAISTIKFGWPNLIQAILNYQRYIVTLPTQIISFDCLMIDYITGSDPKQRFNYLRLYTFYSLPLVAMIFSYIFWLLKSCISGHTRQQRIDSTIATISIIWSLFYPTIVSYLAQSLNCKNIEGVQRLYNDLEEVCFEGQHKLVFYTVSLPGLTLWAFGVPFLALYLVRGQRQQLQNNEFHSDPKFYNNLFARFKLRLGFLTQGYEDKYYYWQVVMLLRQTILVLLLTFFGPISPGVQSLSAELLLLASLVYQIKLQPFYDRRLNQLEVFSISVQMFVIYCGLFYQAGKSDNIGDIDAIKWLVFFLIFTCSMYFAALFATYVRLEMLKATVLRSNSCWFRVLSCGRIKDKEKFMNENNVNILGPNEVPLDPNVQELDPVEIRKLRRKSLNSSAGGAGARQALKKEVEIHVIDPSEIDLVRKRERFASQPRDSVDSRLIKESEISASENSVSAMFNNFLDLRKNAQKEDKNQEGNKTQQIGNQFKRLAESFDQDSDSVDKIDKKGINQTAFGLKRTKTYALPDEEKQDSQPASSILKKAGIRAGRLGDRSVQFVNQTIDNGQSKLEADSIGTEGALAPNGQKVLGKAERTSDIDSMSDFESESAGSSREDRVNFEQLPASQTSSERGAVNGGDRDGLIKPVNEQKEASRGEANDSGRSEENSADFQQDKKKGRRPKFTIEPK